MSTKKKEPKPDINKTIESEYKDLESERTLLAYASRKEYVPTIQMELFTILPHKLMAKILSKYKTTMSGAMMIKAIKKAIKQDKIDSYKAVIRKVYETKIKEVHKDNIKLIVETLTDLRYKRERLIKADEFVNAVLQDGDNIQTIAREMCRIGLGSDKKYAGELIEDYEERLHIVKEREAMEGTVGIPTGVRELDEASGGVLPKEMGIIIGESSIGKSLFLLNFGLHAYLNNYNVFFLSVEMSKHEVQFRADSRLSRVKLLKYRTGEFDDVDYQRWQKKMEKLKDHENYFHTECLPRHCTVEMIEEKMDECQDRYQKKIDICIIDYLNILGVEKSRGSSRDWGVQADIAWGLKGLAEDFNDNDGVVLWTANQIKDEDYNAKELSLTSLKYGRAISEVFPLVLGITRDDYDALLNQMKIQVLKYRNMKKLDPIIVSCNFDFATVYGEQRQAKGPMNMKKKGLK